MNGIFISYRRQDSEDATGRIHDHLNMYFGEKAIFRDIDRIHAGANFPKVLSDALDQCAVLVAVIGSDWLNAANSDGARRLDNAEDFVRVEIVTALRRGTPVIPVLVGNANMPSSQQLPSDLVDLAHIHAMALPSNTGFPHAMRRLVERIRHNVLTCRTSSDAG
jgi:hypothetical protein